ncbi:hypothetical protein [Pseudomonas sp. AF32]|uniref:hypothetical protein n=1 Tax=Pseudomonas sp. AF32 TaxID=554390 RepID=UPI0031B57D4F
MPASLPVLTAMAAQVEVLPAGVDLRIQDCIVCVPSYFSFDLPDLGSGIVTGGCQ